MPTAEQQRKLERRISLQTTKRDAHRTVPSTVIHQIVKHQISLFKFKSDTFNALYSNEIGQLKTNKITSDWIYVASNYCTFLFDIDVTLCSEMAIELFTAFYLILKLSFKKLTPSEVANLPSSDQKNIEIFFQSYNDLLNRTKASYFKEVIVDVEKSITKDKPTPQVAINNNYDSNLERRRSLDPKSFQAVQSPSELYPQVNDSDSESDLASESSSISAIDDHENVNNTRKSPAVFSDLPLMNNIDTLTLKSLDTHSLIIININSSNINSSKRKIVTINPAFINDINYYRQNITPYLTKSVKIVLFSESATITTSELTVFNNLVNLGYQNVYWLEGGFRSFKKSFMKQQTTPTIPEATAFPELPSLNDFESPNIPQSNGRSTSPLFNGRISSIPSTGKPLSVPSSNNQTLTQYNTISDHSLYSLQKPPTDLYPGSPFNRGPHPLPTVPSTPIPQRYDNMKLNFKPLVTLKNMGSTCYINSLIQCLFSTKEFRNFFIDDGLIKTYLSNLNTNKNGKRLPLTSAFHELFNIFYQYSTNGAPPPLIDMTRFLSVIAKLNSDLKIPHEQQDTSQFLYFIIDELHTELKLASNDAQKLGFVTVDHSNYDNEKYNDWKIKILENEGFSYIQNLFNIKESVIMKCERCGYKSTRYDTSVMVHLSVKGSSNSLLEVIERNFYSEEMSKRLGNSWDCDGCKKANLELEKLQQKFEKVLESENEKQRIKEKEKDKEVKKKKRFLNFSSKQSTSNTNALNYSDSETNLFDFEVLNHELTEYEKSEYNRLSEIFTREKVAFRSVELVELPKILVFCLSVFNTNRQDAKTVLKDLKYPEILDMKFSKCEKKYKLNSWIDHWGSNSHSGHYTATVTFEDNKWITCDDDKLHNPNNKTGAVKNNSVYLLFYEAIE